jgi:hypothetical protein
VILHLQVWRKDAHDQPVEVVECRAEKDEAEDDPAEMRHPSGEAIVDRR